MHALLLNPLPSTSSFLFNLCFMVLCPGHVISVYLGVFCPREGGWNSGMVFHPRLFPVFRQSLSLILVPDVGIAEYQYACFLSASMTKYQR